MSLGTTLKVLISSVWHCFLSLESLTGQSGLRINLQRTGSLWVEGRGCLEILQTLPRAVGHAGETLGCAMRKVNAMLLDGKDNGNAQNTHLPAVFVLTSLMFQQQ